MTIIGKIIHRLFRIFTFRKGIYGKIGKKNVFRQNVFIHEMTSVGNHNHFGRDTMITKAVIGNYCSIAPGVKIGQAMHSLSYITTYNNISSQNIGFNMFPDQTIIGNDVWIGANAVIMQGVTIGNGAVIGAGAIVTKDVPAYAVFAGVPAKLIKYRFDDEAIQKLNSSSWWNYDIKKACEIVKSLEREIL
ncbi:MAG: CatB-related O-acetyltransferase [Clostridia bacterium]|nr:CatB-related O-acetyltransferase [Clostridia bacterium]